MQAIWKRKEIIAIMNDWMRWEQMRVCVCVCGGCWSYHVWMTDWMRHRPLSSSGNSRFDFAFLSLYLTSLICTSSFGVYRNMGIMLCKSQLINFPWTKLVSTSTRGWCETKWEKRETNRLSWNDNCIWKTTDKNCNYLLLKFSFELLAALTLQDFSSPQQSDQA